MTRVEDFIISSAIGPEGTDAQLFMRRFREDMERGLRKQQSSLAMIPAYVCCSDTTLEGRSAVAIDIGGTNLRVALVRFDSNGAAIEHFKAYPTPGTKGALKWEEFINVIAAAVKPLTSYADRIGICISFPADITPERDAVIHHFTKEVKVCGFESRLVCRELTKALGVDGIEIKAVNDTTAVLLSGLSTGKDRRGLLGFINGTGTNICCQVDCGKLGIGGGESMIVDVESGGFCPPDKNEIDRLLDSATISPGVYEEEKIVSGAYLGEICALAFKAAARQGVFSAESAERVLLADNITTPDMDAFAAGGAYPLFTSETDAENARKIVEAVFKRAAKHTALSLVSCADFALEAKQKAIVSADGSVFRKSALFRASLCEYVSEYAPVRKFEFITMDDSTLIGTAIGALI